MGNAKAWNNYTTQMMPSQNSLKRSIFDSMTEMRGSIAKEVNSVFLMVPEKIKVQHFSRLQDKKSSTSQTSKRGQNITGLRKTISSRVDSNLIRISEKSLQKASQSRNSLSDTDELVKFEDLFKTDADQVKIQIESMGSDIKDSSNSLSLQKYHTQKNSKKSSKRVSIMTIEENGTEVLSGENSR